MAYTRARRLVARVRARRLVARVRRAPAAGGNTEVQGKALGRRKMDENSASRNREEETQNRSMLGARVICAPAAGESRSVRESLRQEENG